MSEDISNLGNILDIITIRKSEFIMKDEFARSPNKIMLGKKEIERLEAIATNEIGHLFEMKKEHGCIDSIFGMKIESSDEDSFMMASLEVDESSSSSGGMADT